MPETTPAVARTSIRDSLLVFASIVIILAGARYSANVLVPFLLAVFIAVICSAPIRMLAARGMPRSLAVTLVGLAAVGLLLAVFFLIGSAADDFAAAMPGYEQQFTALVDRWAARLEGWGVSVSEEGVARALDPAAVMGYFGSFLGGLGDALGNFVLILFTVLFILADASSLPAKMAAMSNGRETSYVEPATVLLLSMNNYVRTKALVSALTGGIIWVGLILLDTPFAALWGFLAFLLNFIPNVGSIIAAVPPVLLSLLEGSPLLTGSLVALYVVVNMVVGNVIEPRWMGQAVGLSTLAVFVSLVFWGYMFGAVGMLLSVPLTMVIKFLTLLHPRSAWFGILLSNWPPSDQAATAGGEESPRV
ncbi:AI-2E family transporter [Halioglobus maricola]|uniref:AI-2E family transporter n=1 Tax=Halioglobus maricola TaxID=2601894 RepID=A0A5P9NFM0_9GAMM|nr:AI-2E family transporter [Halioglobus maricola]QFU74306.1 AI-2E family transporter [Halioglobus maricola]